MKTESNNGKLVLLAVPLGFAMYSYSQKYSFAKGALVTVLGSVVVGVVFGVGSVVYFTNRIVNKDFTK
jgi:hypothetical protein